MNRKSLSLFALAFFLSGCAETGVMVRGTGSFAPLAQMIAVPVMNAHETVAGGMRYQTRRANVSVYEQNGRIVDQSVHVEQVFHE